MELLVHFNKRVKSRPSLQLPVKELMNLYQDPSSSSFLSVIISHEWSDWWFWLTKFFLQNFIIIYIKMGFPRLGLPQQAELLPLLLDSLNGKPVQHLDSLLFIALTGLSCVDVSTELLKQPYLFLKEKTELSNYIREFFLDIILLPYGSALSFLNWLLVSVDLNSSKNPERLLLQNFSSHFISKDIFKKRIIRANLSLSHCLCKIQVSTDDLLKLKVDPSGCKCGTNPTGEPTTSNEPSGMETSRRWNSDETRTTGRNETSHCQIRFQWRTRRTGDPAAFDHSCGWYPF